MRQAPDALDSKPKTLYFALNYAIENQKHIVKLHSAKKQYCKIHTRFDFHCPKLKQCDQLKQ